MATVHKSIWYYRAAAAQWLRYERQCVIVAIERGICRGGAPDVCGIDKNRWAIEVEIKRTLQDFKNNNKKMLAFHRRYSLYAGTRWVETINCPRLFYFFVPPSLVTKVTPLLTDGDGLITIQEPCRHYRGVPYPRVVVLAKPDNKAKPLSLAECARMVKHQSGTLSSLATELSRIAGDTNES